MLDWLCQKLDLKKQTLGIVFADGEEGCYFTKKSPCICQCVPRLVNKHIPDGFGYDSEHVHVKLDSDRVDVVIVDWLSLSGLPNGSSHRLYVEHNLQIGLNF